MKIPAPNTTIVNVSRAYLKCRTLPTDEEKSVWIYECRILTGEIRFNSKFSFSIDQVREILAYCEEVKSERK